jgi:O-methyltransferase involved in polyketide biosynthesis
MTTTLPTFTPLENSLWLTLCARALDHRSPRSILGDAAADEIVRTLDYDHRRLNIDANLRVSVALRAKKLDEVAAGFLARHPDAVGLDLGAGLDTRLARLDAPATVDWYDVDLPAVAAARERLTPARPNGHIIGADVRDAGWLDAVPTDRPAVIVADGLMGFLTKDEMVTLWNRLVNHFPGGELVFNSYSRSALWLARHAPGTKSVADLIAFPGMDDPREPESWNPRLHLVREILLSREPEVAEFPLIWRLYHRLAARSTGWSRKGTIVLRYRF